MENMTKAQLQAVMTQKGLAFKAKDTKEALIKALKDAAKKAGSVKPEKKEFGGEY